MLAIESTPLDIPWDADARENHEKKHGKNAMVHTSHDVCFCKNCQVAVKPHIVEEHVCTRCSETILVVYR